MLSRRAKTVKAGRGPVVYTVVDMFCGCGGLTVGLESTGRFRTIIGIDSAQDALRTFAHNHRSDERTPQTMPLDIARLDPTTVRSALRKQGLLTGELDCLVGGPPCEGFSQNHGKKMAGRGHAYLAHMGHSTKWWYRSKSAVYRGAAAPLNRSALRDERNTLFRKILEVAKLVKPKVVLIENVRELLTFDDGALKDEIIRTLTELGYHVELHILNAADYGVPQLRQRAFFVGARKDVHEAYKRSLFPSPTHRAKRRGDGPSRLTGDRGIHVTTWEAIGDLPAAECGNRIARKNMREETSQYRSFVRSAKAKTPTHHIVRPITERVLVRIKAIKPGSGMRLRQLPARLRTKKFYANAYARLIWNQPANTITKSFTNLGSGKFGHPSKHRGITVREAARLQSFPDGFEFLGRTQKAVADMIGGAVPPLLARAFGFQFAEALDASSDRVR